MKVRISANPPDEFSRHQFVQVDLKPADDRAMLVKTTAAGEETEIIPAGTLLQRVLQARARSRSSRRPVLKVPSTTWSSGPYARASDPGEGRVAVQMKTSGKTYDYREYWGTIRVQPGNGAGELWVYNFVQSTSMSATSARSTTTGRCPAPPATLPRR